MAHAVKDIVNKYNSYSNTTLNLLLIYLFVGRFGVEFSEIDRLINAIEAVEENIGVLIPSPSVVDATQTSEFLSLIIFSRTISVNDATTTSESITVAEA